MGDGEKKQPRPLILIRGFGGISIEDDRRNAYQGFNDGTVYPHKRGHNYIYEGFVIRALKSKKYPYTDATDVVGYYSSDMPAPDPTWADVADWETDMISGRIVLDPSVVKDQGATWSTRGTIWVFRYYDLNPRNIGTFADGLVTLLQRIRYVTERTNEAKPEEERVHFEGVDAIAHSMGGLILREAMRRLHDGAVKDNPAVEQGAKLWIHRAVTLGTPHRGISFQRLPDSLLGFADKADGTPASELAAFNPTSDKFLAVQDWFPLDHLLTVVGTNYRDYDSSVGERMLSATNRLTNFLEGNGLHYNRSDGLVKQNAAQLPGAPRTFVHKPHGGPDSLVTARESYEIAMRFFHGTHHIRLFLQNAEVFARGDFFGRDEFFFGVSIKPRFVDFSLFDQSAAAENCYGPFAKRELDDEGLNGLQEFLSKPLTEDDNMVRWAGPDRMIWEGWIDADVRPPGVPDMVFRLEVYVSERDILGLGFSDNIVFHRQYLLQVIATDGGPEIFVHTSEQTLRPPNAPAGGAPESGPDMIGRCLAIVGEEKSKEQPARFGRVQHAQSVNAQGVTPGTRWTFEVGGIDFAGTLAVDVIKSDQTA